MNKEVILSRLDVNAFYHDEDVASTARQPGGSVGSLGGSTMTTAEFVTHLQAVKRNGKGWTARCPAHDDRNPSLSVREGRQGILLKCWAGCRVDEICGALGVRVAGLFYDAGLDPMTKAKARVLSQARREREATIRSAELHRPAIFREADTVLEKAKGVEISKLTPDELDQVVDAVADAHLILLEEERENG